MQVKQSLWYLKLTEKANIPVSITINNQEIEQAK